LNTKFFGEQGRADVSTFATLEPQAQTVDDLHDLIFELLRPSTAPTIPTAVDHAYEMIWRLLIRGERKAGERLADTELASQLGLSRTPVRQALHRLAHEDLVRFDARRGFSVREFGAQDVYEIYDVRSVLEVLAVRLAAPHLSPEVLATQLSRLRAARSALRGTELPHAAIAHLRADIDLHNVLIQASGNRRLIRTLAGLRSQQTLFQYWDTLYPGANEMASTEHEAILLALTEHDTSKAARAMTTHITNSRNRVLRDIFGVTKPRVERQR
jgi:DNA-binding GntR family transcriptional regulator